MAQSSFLLKQDAVFSGSDSMTLTLMLWLLSKQSLSAVLVFSDRSLSAMIALWLISDLERWRLTALNKDSSGIRTTPNSVDFI